MRDAVEKAASRILANVKAGRPIEDRDLSVIESRYRFESHEAARAERIGSMPGPEFSERIARLEDTIAGLQEDMAATGRPGNRSVRETLEDLIRKAGRHQVAECLKTLGGLAVEVPQPHAAVRRALRMARDIEGLGPGQGIDLDDRWSAWRSLSPTNPRYLLKRGNLPELTATHPSEIVLEWIRRTGRLP